MVVLTLSVPTHYLCMITSGKYKVPSSVTSVLGLEASGSIAAVGPDCTTDIAKVGTKVFAVCRHYTPFYVLPIVHT